MSSIILEEWRVLTDMGISADPRSWYMVARRGPWTVLVWYDDLDYSGVRTLCYELRVSLGGVRAMPTQRYTKVQKLVLYRDLTRVLCTYASDPLV